MERRADVLPVDELVRPNPHIQPTEWPSPRWWRPHLEWAADREVEPDVHAEGATERGATGSIQDAIVGPDAYQFRGKLADVHLDSLDSTDATDPSADAIATIA